MHFDLDQARNDADKVLPWKCTLTLCGAEITTVAPTVAQMAQLERLGTMDREETIALIRDLCVHQRSTGNHDPAAWGIEGRSAFLTAYMAYFMEYATKKTKAIAQTVKAAMAGSQTQAAGTRTGVAAELS